MKLGFYDVVMKERFETDNYKLIFKKGKLYAKTIAPSGKFTLRLLKK